MCFEYCRIRTARFHERFGRLFADGRPDEALEMQEETLRLTKSILGDRRPNSLTAMEHLAGPLPTGGGSMSLCHYCISSSSRVKSCWAVSIPARPAADDGVVTC